MPHEHELDHTLSHHTQEPDDYWTTDVAIGTVHLWDRDWMLRLQAHVGEETWYRSIKDHELIPLKERRGTRTYVMAKPYLLEPAYAIGIALHDQPGPGDVIGHVSQTEWVGMRRRHIGAAQGWYYPTERAIILWECFLDRHATRFVRTVRGAEHDVRDANLGLLWRGFERFLLGQFPDATQLVTTHTDPLYPTEDYQAFLRDQGYTPLRPGAFAKEVAR